MRAAASRTVNPCSIKARARRSFSAVMTGLRPPRRPREIAAFNPARVRSRIKSRSAGGTPPAELLAFVADQLDVDVVAFDKYQRRDQTRREQLAELMARFGYQTFDRASSRR